MKGNILKFIRKGIGRVIAENIKNPVTGETIIKKDKLIDEFDCEKIDAAGVNL